MVMSLVASVQCKQCVNLTRRYLAMTITKFIRKRIEMHLKRCATFLVKERVKMPKWTLQEKPADVSWTDEQWQAISLKGGNILVAAAAGSGKTAVLVERIVKRMIDPNDEAEMDRLLVVTFTKAAAAE